MYIFSNSNFIILWYKIYFKHKFSKSYFNSSILTFIILYKSKGLHRDDILHETEEVREALKRVPPHIIEERDFRIIRAMQLDCQKKILPKEQWTKFEDVI